MRRVNQYSEQVRDMHVVFERHTRTSCVQQNGEKNASLHIFHHLNRLANASTRTAVQKLLTLELDLFRPSLPSDRGAQTRTTKQTAHTTVIHAAAQTKGERGKAYLLQGTRGERNGKKKGRMT